MAEHTLTDALERSAREHFVVQRFRISVVQGPDTGLGHATRKERLVIGTHRSADFILHDPTMSRFHCEIALTDGIPVLRDLDSKNGTRVNGVAVRVAPLFDGAILAMGQTQLRFDAGSEDLEVPLSKAERFGSLVGRSRKMRSLFARLEQIAAADATVLLLGETGTGKDVAAESIHRMGARKDRPYVVVDCGAIVPSLVEAQLFGYTQGAFTGAHRAQIGAFQAADGGTLFLDEVGELAADLQPKLLRFLETQEVCPVGSTQRIRVDVRIIGATNRDLKQEVNAGRFRSDLYYRLAVVELIMPPLRERLEDLPLLVAEVIETMGATTHPGAELLRSPDMLAQLQHHSWPGNVRELRNHLERCLAIQDLAAFEQRPELEPPGIDATRPFREAHERWHRSYLQALMKLHGGNSQEACRAAGIARSHLYRLLARYGLR